jgi:hypothetical protein
MNHEGEMKIEEISFENMNFIFVPIVKKWSKIFEYLVDKLPHLWSMDDVRLIQTFLK